MPLTEPSALGAIALALAGMIAVGHPLRALLARAGVPAAVTLLAVGVLLGPSLLDALPAAYLEVRDVASRTALVVILLRAGLGVSPRVLRVIAWPSLVFGTLPVLAECLALTALTRELVFDSWRVSLLAGFLIAAVSPAVVIPAMQRQREAGVGAAHALPDRIMGMTLVNALVAQTGILTMIELTRYWAPYTQALRHVYAFPLLLAGGTLLGVLVGRLLPVPGSGALRRVFWLPVLAIALAVYFGTSALGLESVFATLGFALALRARDPVLERELREPLRRAWSLAEIVLFVTLGSQVDVTQLSQGWIVLAMVGITTAGVAARLLATAGLNARSVLDPPERRHVLVSSVPKATLQAVFGALPLQIFLEHEREPLYLDGARLLVLSVVAIVLTAPLGAWAIEISGRRLLRRGP